MSVEIEEILTNSTIYGTILAWVEMTNLWSDSSRGKVSQLMIAIAFSLCLVMNYTNLAEAIRFYHKKGMMPITVVVPKGTNMLKTPYVNSIIKILKWRIKMVTTERNPWNIIWVWVHRSTLSRNYRRRLCCLRFVRPAYGCLAQGETICWSYENIESARRLWLESALMMTHTGEYQLPEMKQNSVGKFNVSRAC